MCNEFLKHLVIQSGRPRGAEKKPKKSHLPIHKEGHQKYTKMYEELLRGSD